MTQLSELTDYPITRHECLSRCVPAHTLVHLARLSLDARELLNAVAPRLPGAWLVDAYALVEGYVSELAAACAVVGPVRSGVWGRWLTRQLEEELTELNAALREILLATMPLLSPVNDAARRRCDRCERNDARIKDRGQHRW